MRASSSAYTALMVCLTLCVSSPIQGSEEAGLVGDVTSLLQVEDGAPGEIAAAIAMVRADKNAVEHIKDAENAYHGAVAQKAPVEDPPKVDQPKVDEKANAAEKESKAAVKAASQTAATKDTHSATWHCQHCGTSCKTAKCKSWCEKRWCKQNSPLFQDVALTVPPGADNKWHCAHCKGVCKTNKCNSWCKKMWCPMDADGNAYRPHRNGRFGLHARGKARWHKGVKIHGGKGKMELLEISKKGSPKLIAMEQNANKIIALSNKDTTGKLLNAAGNAVEAVINQREHEANSFKERETKANEADSKRYDKTKYEKWKNEKDGADGAAAAAEMTAAKEATQKDNAKEIKFKTQSDDSAAATKDLDKKIDEENKKFEEKEASAEQINKDHKQMVAPDQAVFHMKNPSL